MANNQNLRPLTKEQLTPELQSERGKKGGKRSQEVQHQKKTLAQLFTIWANGKPKPKDILLLESLGIEIPSYIKFSDLVLTSKNVDLGYRDRVTDIMKDVYDNV